MNIDPYWQIAIPNYLRLSALVFFVAGAYPGNKKAANAIAAGLALWGLATIFPSLI